MIFLNKVIALFSAFICLFTGAGFDVNIDFVSPYLSVIGDAARVGLDYVSISPDRNAVTKAQLQSKLEAAGKNISHPFILADKSRFDLLRSEYLNGTQDEYVKSLTDFVMPYADKLCGYKPLEYKLDEEDAILEISRETMSRVIILGVAWQITGNEKYSLRAWEELENVCNFKDWCNSHFLDTAEMALAVSIGYDWFYDCLSNSQKELLCDTVWSYAIEPALSLNHFKNWFVWSKTNWNSICYSGIGIACMAFSYRDTQKAAQFLKMCYSNMPIAFESFTPDGVYAEGPGYWESGTSSLVYFVESSKNLFGTDYGLSDTEGFEELGSFPLYVCTPTGVFNYGDNKLRMPYSPILHWYASHYKKPLLTKFQMSGTLEKQMTDEPGTSGGTDGTYSLAKESALSALWYNREYGKSDESYGVKLCECLNSDAGESLAVMRSAYLDSNATYAAIKGGYNYTNHGDLDIGTFVFDSMGVRWAEELGPGSYDAPDYFVGLPGFGRWKNYCKRAEGQNTLVINPKAAAEDQYALARCGFTEFYETDGGAVAVLDMTDAYSLSFGKSVKRTFELYNNKSCLRISDSVSCKVRSEIYWFMHTKAEIKLSEDGKTALLTRGGHIMKAALDSDGQFSVMPAVSLFGKYEYDKDYSDMSKLTVHVENVKDADITVTFEPVK